MITCNISGGLGNQLFQIFATISYSITYSQPFGFFYSAKVGKRSAYWETILIHLKPYTNLKPMRCTIINENMISSIRPILSNICMSGYYQSEKYFKQHYDTICKMIGLAEFKSTLANNYTNCISMHFRRGDYLQLTEYYVILGLDYYRKSIETILQKDDSMKTVLYFCEESDEEAVSLFIDELRSIFPFLLFERINASIPDWEQMIIMSNCNHNIIANSTFSWWGAYFNNNPNKIVCSPDQWYAEKLQNINMDHLLPNDWIKIKTI